MLGDGTHIDGVLRIESTVPELVLLVVVLVASGRGVVVRWLQSDAAAGPDPDVCCLRRPVTAAWHAARQRSDPRQMLRVAVRVDPRASRVRLSRDAVGLPLEAMYLLTPGASACGTEQLRTAFAEPLAACERRTPLDHASFARLTAAVPSSARVRPGGDFPDAESQVCETPVSAATA